MDTAVNPPLVSAVAGRNEAVSDVAIRKAKTDDCEVIVSFIRMMLKEMSNMGGHPENQDESFWKSFIATVLPAIENSDRLYLIVENNDGPVGFFEGRVDMPYQVFEPKKSFHINSVYIIGFQIKTLIIIVSISGLVMCNQVGVKKR